jgi:hypothetical protein
MQMVDRGARPLGYWPGQVLSVWDYGALGDGSADDTAALQRALDAIVSGDTLVVPQGRYVVNGELTLADVDDVNIIGEGATIPQAGSLKTTLQISNCDRLTAQGLYMTGLGTDYDNSVTTVARGVEVLNCDDLTITHCRFYNFGNSAIFFHGLAGASISRRVVISSNQFKGPGSTEITAADNKNYAIGATNGTDSVIVNGITITGNHFWDWASAMILGATTENAVIVGNYFYDILGEHGIYMSTGFGGVQISNNNFRNIYADGIKCQIATGHRTGDAEGLVINGNVLVDTSVSTANWAINVGRASGTELHESPAITGNSIFGGTGGIVVQRANNMTLNSNSINVSGDGLSVRDVLGGIASGNQVTAGGSYITYAGTNTGFTLHGKGTGTPKNAVAAPPGSTWDRTDGGADTTRYIKQTGTGSSTGWYVLTSTGLAAA